MNNQALPLGDKPLDPNLEWSPSEILVHTPVFPEMLPPSHPTQKAYLNFYQIDFASQFEADHWTTLLPVGTHQVHLHVVKLRHGSKGTLLFIHGLFDHSGLFGRYFFQWLQRGYNLVAVDWPGHGLSTGEPAVIDSFDEYEEVLKKVLSLGNALAESHWIGSGQSTGAGIWMYHLIKHNLKKPPVKELFLNAPLVYPKQYSWIKVLYHSLKWFKKSVPRQFQPNSSDSVFQELLQFRDPLQARHIPIKWVKSLILWTKLLDSVHSNLSYQSLNDRIHVIQGTADLTVDWGYNLKWIHRIFPNADIMKIEGAGHHILNETSIYDDALWDIMSNWLSRNRAPS